MTFYELPIEEQTKGREMIYKIIGKKADCVEGLNSNSDRIKARFEYDKLFDKLARIYANNGAKALSMTYTSHGAWLEGVTPGGKKWVFNYNTFGWTQRTHHCGSLYVEGVGTLFTSGTLARAFERLLEY